MGDAAVEQRDQWLMATALGIGVSGLIAGLVAGAVLEANIVVYVGIATFWLGIAGHEAIRKRSTVTLFDERDTRIDREASAVAVRTFVYLFVVGAPPLVTLAVTDTSVVPQQAWGVLSACVLLFLVYAIAYVVLGDRHL